MLRRFVLRLFFQDGHAHHERRINEKEQRHAGQGAWFLAGAVLLPFGFITLFLITQSGYAALAGAVLLVAVPVVTARILERSMLAFGFPQLFVGRLARGLRLTLMLVGVFGLALWLKTHGTPTP